VYRNATLPVGISGPLGRLVRRQERRRRFLVHRVSYAAWQRCDRFDFSGDDRMGGSSSCWFGWVMA